MILEDRSHEERVRAVTVFWLERYVYAFFIATISAQRTIVPHFLSSVFEAKELGRNIRHRVCEMNHSIVVTRELLHDVVRELTISYTWLAIRVHINLSQEP